MVTFMLCRHTFFNHVLYKECSSIARDTSYEYLLFRPITFDIMTLFDYGKQYTESWKVNVVNFIIKLVIFTFEDIC